MTYANVLDVSGHQFDGYKSGGPVVPGTPDPNLRLAQILSINGIFARVANGLVYDPWCELTLRAAEHVGMQRGVYTYIQPGRSAPNTQAFAHLDMIKRAGSITLPVMIDCENFFGQEQMTEQQFADWLRIYVDVIEHELGAPIKYSAKWWWDKESTGDFGELDCMLARYPAQPSSKPPSQWEQPPVDAEGWARWALEKAPTGPPLIEGEDHWDGWQFSSWLIARDYGFQAGHRIDGNIVNMDAWHRWTNVVVPPQPVPPLPGVSMILTNIDPWDLPAGHYKFAVNYKGETLKHLTPEEWAADFGSDPGIPTATNVLEALDQVPFPVCPPCPPCPDCPPSGDIDYDLIAQKVWAIAPPQPSTISADLGAAGRITGRLTQ
jgi:hypothetical protein